MFFKKVKKHLFVGSKINYVVISTTCLGSLMNSYLHLTNQNWYSVTCMTFKSALIMGLVFK